MNIFGSQYEVNDLRRRVGAMDQVAGIRMMQWDDGRARPARAALFHTGSGLTFTVALDRGMDLAHADFQGRPMGWRATAGDVAPQYFEPEGARWLRSFFGGLLTTCGLSSVGAPAPGLVSAVSGDGLHGRIGNTPAENLSVVQEWCDGAYVLSVTGTMREARLFGENLAMTRTVSTRLGSSEIAVRDVVANEGFRSTPLMMLYHCNIGWPAVDAGSRVLAPTRAVAPRDATARDGLEDWAQMGPPVPGYAEKVYYHDMAPDDEGWVTAAIVNGGFSEGAGFGVYVRYKHDTLPRFAQWKQLGEQDYVCGLEPANCGVEGRHVDAQRGLLSMLEPGERRSFELMFGAIATAEEAEAVARRCAGVETRFAAHYSEFVRPGKG